MRALASTLGCACILATACGRLADGDHRGPPLAVIEGALTHGDGLTVHGEMSLALQWRPSAELAHLLDGRTAPAGGCPALDAPAPSCDGSPSQGGGTCSRRTGLVAEVVQVVGHETSLPNLFAIPISDVPPAPARFDLARQGGSGTFALAAIVAFDDVDRDGAFRLGGPADPPEPGLGSSARPADGQPRLSYLLAFLDGYIAPERIDPAYAEPLLFVPQGFSIWIEEEWRDARGRTEALARYWGPVRTPIELALVPDDLAGCAEEELTVTYLSAMPDAAPASCSPDGMHASWSRAWATAPCRGSEERFEVDFGCALSPPPLDCPVRTTGSLRVAAITFGELLDLDGFTVRVDGGTPRWIPPNTSVPYPALQPGGHDVALDGIAANCAVMGRNPATVQVTAGQASSQEFTVACGRTREGTIRVRVATTGSTPDPDGYTVSVDGNLGGVVGPTGVVVLPGLEPGLRAVSLGGLAPHCAVVGENPLQVALAPGTTADAEFAIACEAPPVAAPPPAGTPAGTLAYVSTSNGDAALQLVAANGALLPVTTGSWDTDPAWSPDGTRIAFTRDDSFTGMNPVLAVVNVDGSGLQQLTSGGAEYHPAWSPDGTRIAFVRGAGIHVMNADGSGVTQLTSGAIDWYPSWSPDGTRIAFARHHAGFWNAGRIWVVNADGSGAAPLTDDPAAADTQPRWSPDGTRIAFVRARCDEGTCHDVHVMNADGTGARLLVSAPDAAGSYLPAWSADGRWLAFTAGDCVFFGTSCRSSVRVMAADGTGLVEVASGGASQAAWRPP